MTLTEQISQLFDDSKFIDSYYSNKKDQYLKHHHEFLLKSYADEHAIFRNIPYSEEICWIKNNWKETHNTEIQIKRESNQFSLDTSSDTLKDFQEEAFKKRNPKLDNQVVRLASVKKITEKTICLTIQSARYFDQVKSNLIMDWNNSNSLKKVGFDTLRSYLISEYGHKLPNFDDNRLANTIGISVILFYEKNGEYIPYLPRRSGKSNLAVFTGGEYHCTASGALEWKDADTFDEIFTEDMYREIAEEVRIYQSEIKFLQPLALCREFLRGGKPQIFYAGITTLPEEEIKERRKLAITEQFDKGVPIEIEDDQLGFKNKNEFLENIKKHFITLEGFANLYYAEKYIYQFKSVDNYYKNGISKFNNKNYSNALNDFNHCINLESNYADAYYYRAICNLKVGNFECAENDITSFYRINNKTNQLLNDKQVEITESNMKLEKTKIDLESEIKEKNKALMELKTSKETIENQNISLKEKELEMEYMMSMFAHKFRSPLDAIIYNTSHEHNPKLYIEAAQTMRGLLDIFSIISTDDKRLTDKIKADNQGNGRLSTVVDKTLNMILLHLLSVSGAEKIQQHYFAYSKTHGKIDESLNYKTWCDDYFELEQALQAEWEQSFSALLNQSASLEQRLNWLEQHFFKLEIIGFNRDDIQFKDYAITESFLIILINEILVNAFKYYSSETKQPVILEWSEKDGYQVLTCKNPSIRKERTKIKGSGKGHTFLSALARKTNSQFTKPKPQDDFVLEFAIPNELLISSND